MAVQSKLPLEEPALPGSSRVAHAAQRSSTAPRSGSGELAPIWLQRLSLGVLVVFCLYLGCLLVYLPWWREMWDNNSLLLAFPRVHHYAIQGPVRGLVSGVGLLDLWIGISEVIHYKEYRS